MIWSIDYNPYWVLVVFIAWTILLINSNPQLAINNASQNIQVRNKWLFVVLFILLCVLGLHRWDTYHMTEYWINDNFNTHLEPFHRWIIDHISHDSILLYRIIIFGTTSALYLYTAKRLGVFTNNFCLVTCIFIIDSMFCEMRGTIGVMTMIFSTILLLSKERFSISRTVLASALLCSSFFMHRSMSLGLLIAAIALLRFDKKDFIIGSWIAFPFLVPIIRILLNTVLSGAVDLSFGDEMDLASSVEEYGNQTQLAYNTHGKIIDIFTKLPLWISFFYLSIRIGFRQIQMTRVFSYLFRLYYLMFYLGALFLFVETSSWIAIRISVMSIYPLPFLLAKTWEEESQKSIWLLWIILLAIIVCIFNFTYRIYLWG